MQALIDAILAMEVQEREREATRKDRVKKRHTVQLRGASLVMISRPQDTDTHDPELTKQVHGADSTALRQGAGIEAPLPPDPSAAVSRVGAQCDSSRSQMPARHEVPEGTPEKVGGAFIRYQDISAQFPLEAAQ